MRARPKSRWRSARRRRRLLMLALILLGTFGVVGELTQHQPATATLVVAKTDLPAGHTIVEADVVEVTVPADSPLLPTAPSRDDVIGQTTVGRLSGGDVLAKSRLLDSAVAQTPGYAAVPLRLPDAALLAFLRPGMLLDLVWDPSGLGNEPARVVARGVRVLVTSEEPERDGGLLAASAQASDLILVEVPTEKVVAVAEAQGSGTISIVLRSGL